GYHHDRVAQDECRVHASHLRGREVELLHDLRTGNRHDRAVEVAHHAASDHQGDDCDLFAVGRHVRLATSNGRRTAGGSPHEAPPRWWFGLRRATGRAV